MKKKLGIILMVAVLAIGSFACKKSKEEDPKPGANEVWLQGTAFSPASITVSVGTTITWTNKDNTQHTVTSDDGGSSFDSSTMENGKTFSHAFSSAGTFKYHCNFHGSMTGTVIVQ